MIAGNVRLLAANVILRDFKNELKTLTVGDQNRAFLQIEEFLHEVRRNFIRIAEFLYQRIVERNSLINI